MRGIDGSSKRIADIIGVIDAIAFQTNILALNAAVEAARAGEQGRGFAVVATEVRNLAGRSAEAAREIKTLITESVDRVAQGTVFVGQAGSTMTDIVASIRCVTDIMSEISSASSEQSAGVMQVNQAVAQMDHGTQQNAALVEQMAAAASSLKSQASELVETVAEFKLAAATREERPAAHATAGH
jgi:methyl-accepting chemotaxis protein